MKIQGMMYRLVGVIVTFVLCATVAAAQVPRLLNYQGVLTDEFQVAVPDGSYQMTFRLYDAASGGAPLWEETNTIATFDGVFETILGLTSPIALPFDRDYWLALELTGEPEMVPRIRMVSAPYAITAESAGTAAGLDPDAPDVVHTLNGLDGRLTLVGAGLATITEGGDEITVTVANPLPGSPTDGQILRYNGSTGAWEAVALRVETSPRLGGDGSAGAPLDIAQMGATDGQPLVWDATSGTWSPGESGVTVVSPLGGDGTAGSPVGMLPGTIEGQLLFWNGTAWMTSANVDPDAGAVMVWDESGKRWTPAETRVQSDQEITGDGTAAAPLRLAQQGATEGQVLRWDPTAGAFRPGPSVDVLTPPLDGTGGPGDPLRFQDGANAGEILYWNGAGWRRSAPVDPEEGWVLVWDDANSIWRPGVAAISDMAPLSSGAIWYGNGANLATELALGSVGQVLISNGTQPTWSGYLQVDSIDLIRLGTSGDVSVGGSLDVGGDVVLQNGVIDNAELANSQIAVSYGQGLAGDPAVELGDTLDLQNVGVWTVNAGTGIVVDTTAGDVTVANSGVLTLTGGAGISVDTTAGDVTITNDGVRTLTAGTGVAVDTTAGDVTVINTGVTSLTAGAGIEVDSTTGAVTVTNAGVRTLTAGTGVAVDTTAGDVTVINTGVTSLTAGAGIEVDSTTGAVTVTNAGVRTLTAGTGVAVDTTAGDVMVINTGVTSLTGGPGISVDTTSGAVTITNDGVRTLTAGSGIAVDTTAGDVTVINTGVTALNAGAGIEVDTTAGAVTVTNSGVRTLTAGTGITIDTTAGDVTVANGGVLTLTGTLNQIIVDTSAGDITLSAPQDLDSNATPVFDGLTLDNLLSSSLSDTLLVSNAGMIESRTFASLANVFDTLFWRAEGNIGTTPGANFLGTRDAAALEIHVYDDSTSGIDGRGRIVRYDPDTASPRITAGYQGNIIAPSGFGSVISGGGLTGDSNVIHDEYSVIGGGYGNEITGSTIGLPPLGRATIGGGSNNTIQAWQGTIAGGAVNRIGVGSRDGSIGGGGVNQILDHSSWGTIGGGYRNQISDSVTVGTIAGGVQDTIGVRASYSTIGGGFNNVIGPGSQLATIDGGYQNRIDSNGLYSGIGGGRDNYIGVGSIFGVIGGGFDNRIDSGADYVFIGGGNGNMAESSVATIGGGTRNRALGPGSFIGGGYQNFAFDNDATIAGGARDTTYGLRSFMGAGEANLIDSNAAWATLVGGRESVIGKRSSFAFIGGGLRDSIGVLSGHAIIVGGRNNFIADSSSYSVIGGGFENRINPRSNVSVIGGGRENSIAQDYSVIAGGRVNTVSDHHSFIGSGSGNDVSADHASIVGGTDNHVAGGGGFIGGGIANYAEHFDGTIAGGGFDTTLGYRSFIGAGERNFIDTSSFASIVSGRNNRIDRGAFASAIGSGQNNYIAPGNDVGYIGGGDSNVINGGDWVFLGGGNHNRASSNVASVVGGTRNHASGPGSFVGGGIHNFVDNNDGAIVGGDKDTVLGRGSFIGAGRLNYIESVDQAVIVGGIENRINTSSRGAFIGSGEWNLIDRSLRGVIGGGIGNRLVNANAGVIAGGDSNEITGSIWGFIGGGDRNRVTANVASVVGGTRNHADIPGSFVGGGYENLAAGFDAAIPGGYGDTTYGNQSFIGSGSFNRIDSSTHTFIGSGTQNSIGNASFASSVLGGRFNDLDSSMYANIAGGFNNDLNTSDYSAIAGGYGLRLQGQSSFGFNGLSAGGVGSPMNIAQPNVAVLGNVDLWLANNTAAPSQLRFYESYNLTGAYPNTANFTSFEAPAALGANVEYVLPAAAGTAGQQLTITGVAGTQVTLGWAAASDRAKKTDFLRLSGEYVLGRFRGLELGTWRYDPSIDPKGTRHYGIMAQDFHHAFGRDDLGVIGTDSTVTDIDLHGVSFLAIQGLEERTSEQSEEIERLRQENQELRRRLEAIEEKLGRAE